MTISEERILKELSQIKSVLINLQKEMKEIRLLVEEREDYLTLEEIQLVDEVNKALDEDNLEEFVKLNAL